MLTPDSNRFAVTGVRAVSAHEAEVTGQVASGEIRKGAWVSFNSPDGLPVTAQIYSVGTKGAPLKVARALLNTALFLGVEARHLQDGTIIETCESEVCAPAMLLTQMASDSRAELPVPPEDLIEIEKRIDKGHYADAQQRLLDAPTDPKTYHIVKRLMAKICLEADGDLRDPVRALDLVREAYSLRGSADPDVNETLARALAENGDPRGGLRYLDRLYTYALDPKSRDYYAGLIAEHRRRFRIPDHWDVLNALGDVVLSTDDDTAIAEQFGRNEFPPGAQVRKNRTGQLMAIAEFVKTVAEIPVIAIDLAPEAPQTRPMRLNPRTVGLGAMVGAVAFAPAGFGAGVPVAAAAAVGAIVGAGIGGYIGRGKQP